VAFDVEKRTILKIKHGSHAYGLNTATSDLDVKGVCIEPFAYHFGFLRSFEQHERMGHEGVDLVVYSLKKFARLAADCNPNIIEVLHGADEDVIFCDEFGEQLREHRYDFISKKAKFTFAGYAHAQLKRIKTHRSWLLNPPKGAPTRSEFGLDEGVRISKSEIGAIDMLITDGKMPPMTGGLMHLFTQERAYAAAKDHFDQFQNWVKSRNPARAALEAKFGFDTKHGMHLLRLMRMCKEILAFGKVIVKRLEDRDELLDVRNGKRPYDGLIEEAERLEAECEELYKTSTLQNEPDREALDKFIVNLTEQYLFLHG
jgi:predicted nucleotidyltransferase